ncbi:hypothetical protein KY290_006215 [Solanum tuberosum]|uniref:Anthranilate N-benzoyltransferase protein n=1 Tax=Solanum tuberosum TaxID=4113 RepID=A0ABQ7WI77_SOLTU|nr:hypothetical protein KY290_006215 [Solanum tuberosum]
MFEITSINRGVTSQNLTVKSEQKKFKRTKKERIQEEVTRLNKDDGNYVDCNDMGVELSHVHVHCPMSQIFRQPYTNDEHVVFPVEQPYAHMHEGNLATIQVSHFDCGGIAIGGCLSHKIGDGCTTSNFFKNWGILTRDINATLSLHFVGDSIYPQSTDPYVVSTIKSEESTYLGKSFMFPVDKLNALKAKIAHESEVQDPTHVEVVSVLLYKCALVTRRVNSSNSFKPSSLYQLENMRESLIDFPLYKVDFGWGRPIRVSMGTGPFNKWFYLLDNQSGGGVEAIVMMDEQHLAIFERDPELLEFASPITNL